MLMFLKQNKEQNKTLMQGRRISYIRKRDKKVNNTSSSDQMINLP